MVSVAGKELGLADTSIMGLHKLMGIYMGDLTL